MKTPYAGPTVCLNAPKRKVPNGYAALISLNHSGTTASVELEKLLYNRYGDLDFDHRRPTI
jgi:hypothetical protein